MSYKVVAACVLAKDKEGRISHVYEGGVIPWIPDEYRQQWIDEGLVVEIASTPADSDDEDGDADEVTDEKPASNANKATLVAWVVANLTQPDGSEYDATELDEDKTKAELWELINSAEE